MEYKRLIRILCSAGFIAGCSGVAFESEVNDYDGGNKDTISYNDISDDNVNSIDATVDNIVDGQYYDSLFEREKDSQVEKTCIWQAECQRFECCSEVCGKRLDGSPVLANTFIWGCCEPLNDTCVDMGDGRWCCQE